MLLSYVVLVLVTHTYIPFVIERERKYRAAAPSMSSFPSEIISWDERPKSIPVVGRISLLICTIKGDQFMSLQNILAYRKCTHKDGRIWGTRKDNNVPFKVVLGDDAHEESSVRLRLTNIIDHRH